jgi:ribonuclease HI
MSEYVLNFDGSCGPKNPGGTAAYGYTILKNGQPFEEDSLVIGSGSEYSNNYAEFYAVYKGLQKLYDIVEPNDKLFIRGDSLLVINVLRKKWRTKEEALYYPAFKLALQMLTGIRSKRILVSLDWIPRAMNQRADALSKYNKV